ncbi:MAG: hypothetical protein K2N05_12895 [Muribaculaceae bacterium]|nr:hypothetical protein [Muribaculaceae bacterium]
MKDNLDSNKIRALLDRWYSGLTSPEEERMLADMLASSTDLPSDLEADRKLFSEINNAGKLFPEMPEVFSSRINEALEKEIAAEREEVAAKAFSRIQWLKIGRVAAAVAIFLGCAFVVMKMIDTTQMDVAGDNMALVNGVEKKMDMSGDTLQNHYLALRSSHPEVIKVASSKSDRKVGVGEGIVKQKRDKVEGPGKESRRLSDSNGQKDHYETDNHLSLHPEEAKLISENYRVVRNQDEADAILNSIFSRLESNVSVETSKLSKINLDYDLEISKLSGIENVGLLNEYTHEETPL